MHSSSTRGEIEKYSNEWGRFRRFFFVLNGSSLHYYHSDPEIFVPAPLDKLPVPSYFFPREQPDRTSSFPDFSVFTFVRPNAFERPPPPPPPPIDPEEGKPGCYINRAVGQLELGQDLGFRQDRQSERILIVELGRFHRLRLRFSSPRENHLWRRAFVRSRTSTQRPNSSVLREEDEAVCCFALGKCRPKGSLSTLRDFSLMDVQYVLKMMASGGFGPSFLARHRRTRELMVVKFAKVESLFQMERGILPHFEKLLCYHLKQMGQHPFVSNVKFALYTPNQLILVFDYCVGGEVFDKLRECIHFEEEEARKYLCQIVLGLEYLHKKDVSVKDLRPEKLVFDDDGRIVITDYGVFEHAYPHSHRSEMFGGACEYFPPEFINGGNLDGPCADCWSLGIVAYEMLAGLPPFYSEGIDDAREQILLKPLTFDKRYFSSTASDFIRKLLVRKPASNRLGAGRNGFSRLKKHPFFRGVDWNSVLEDCLESDDDFAERVDFLISLLGIGVTICEESGVIRINLKMSYLFL